MEWLTIASGLGCLGYSTYRQLECDTDELSAELQREKKRRQHKKERWDNLETELRNNTIKRHALHLREQLDLSKEDLATGYGSHREREIWVREARMLKLDLMEIEKSIV